MELSGTTHTWQGRVPVDVIVSHALRDNVKGIYIMANQFSYGQDFKAFGDIPGLIELRFINTRTSMVRRELKGLVLTHPSLRHISGGIGCYSLQLILDMKRLWEDSLVLLNCKLNGHRDVLRHLVKFL